MAAPRGLGTRGRALWKAMAAAKSFDAAGEVLLAEACRITDRLEKLDRVLRGEVDEWLRIVEPRNEGDDLVLVVDSALTEARQQQNALRQIVATLGLARTEGRGDGDLERFLESLRS